MLEKFYNSWNEENSEKFLLVFNFGCLKSTSYIFLQKKTETFLKFILNHDNFNFIFKFKHKVKLYDKLRRNTEVLEGLFYQNLVWAFSLFS